MNNLSILRAVGIAEGISFLLLLGITMPMKYIFQIPEPTSIVGMAHGILFILYCAYVVIVGYQLKWAYATIFFALLASVLPFGTFVADKRIFKAQ